MTDASLRLICSMRAIVVAYAGTHLGLLPAVGAQGCLNRPPLQGGWRGVREGPCWRGCAVKRALDVRLHPAQPWRARHLRMSSPSMGMRLPAVFSNSGSINIRGPVEGGQW